MNRTRQRALMAYATIAFAACLWFADRAFAGLVQCEAAQSCPWSAR